MVNFLRTNVLGSFCAVIVGMSSAACAGADGSNDPSVASTSQALSMGPVDVIEATYGARCGAPRSNATFSVANQCDGLANCPYQVSVGNLGDPKPYCAKDFDVRWSCGNVGIVSQHVTQEADKQTVTLACQNNMPAAFGTITVLDATYGASCNQPNGNVTWDATLCNGFGSCRYDIRVAFLGDPAVNCSKDFRVRYRCSNHPTVVRTEIASREADGKTVTLTCPQ